VKYDLIGDIHGHAAELKALLRKMDYEEVEGVWQHPIRKPIFIGDYIDRGPAIRETLHIVREMVKADKAIALMGNHEYNALAYAYELPEGSFLRRHNDKNNKQHEATLKQFEYDKEDWLSFLEWFYTLPLYIELPGLRAIHACWDDEHIKWLKKQGISTMNKDFLLASHEQGSHGHRVIEEILKGKELAIPEDYAWEDKDGHKRKENRIRWWVDTSACYGEFLFDCPPQMLAQQIDSEIQLVVYPKDAPPVFFGHYWMKDHSIAIQSANMVCLDYSIAKEGSLVAYRWNGEQEVRDENFVVVKYGEEEQKNVFN
jgi:hypothetical protein